MSLQKLLTHLCLYIKISNTTQSETRGKFPPGFSCGYLTHIGKLLIEVLNFDSTPFEAVEVKHDQIITKAMVDTAKQKIRGRQVDLYYILTTHHQHDPTDDVKDEVENVKKLLGCQMIVNGVLPTIKYYLRLLSNPGLVLPAYTHNLENDGAIGYEHKDIWNKIATGVIKR